MSDLLSPGAARAVALAAALVAMRFVTALWCGQGAHGWYAGDLAGPALEASVVERVGAELGYGAAEAAAAILKVVRHLNERLAGLVR